MAVVACSIAGDATSRCFCLRANGVAVPVIETPPMDALERQRIADEYAAIAPYCRIYDPACMHLHYAQLMASTDVQIEVESSEEIESFRVHPLRRNIEARAAGRVLTLTADSRQPRYFIIRINQLPPLMVAVDPPETSPSDQAGAGVIDASAFLTDATGVIDQTAAFQKAFAAANGTGRTLSVPAGTYLIDQLHVRGGRNFQVHLAAGCLLKVRPSPPCENRHRHGLWLEDCRDVVLAGRGCIDHQAYEHYAHGRNQYQHGMVDYYTSNDLCPWITQSPLFITGCQRIVIEGITIRNGRNFNINARNTDDLTVRGVKILTPPACTPEYADGINTGSCRNVLVENCLVACNDDCFASGHYFAIYDARPSENHVIRGVLGWNMRANGIRLGFYAAHDQGDFTFEDCDFVAMVCNGLHVHALRPGTDGRPSRYGVVRMIDCGFDAPLGSMVAVEKAGMGGLELRNVSFHDLATGSGKLAVAGDAAAPIGRFEMENVCINGNRVTALEQVVAKIENVARVCVR